MIDSLLGPENFRDHLGEGALAFKVAATVKRQCLESGNEKPRLHRSINLTTSSTRDFLVT
jgi:hypothetical protein